MDSVPLTFCRDVFGSLGVTTEEYDELAGALTGRWKAAATQYARNVQMFEVVFGRDEDGWHYWISKRGKLQSVAPTIDELSTLSWRYTQFAVHEKTLSGG
uniref:FBA domain-containing protein n=1 Tax=Steinernema glaseri TaxID=37863 RepID=A0A1I7Y2P7_9BILA